MTLTDDTLTRMADLFRGGRSFLLVPHDRPDGDALGSALALSRALTLRGKPARMHILGGISERYRFLFDGEPPSPQSPGSDTVAGVDAVVLIDTGTRQQIGALAPLLDRHAGKLAIIDHHAHRDLAADYLLVDPHCPATGILTGTLLDHLGWLTDPKIAEYLLVAIASDTGWFAYSNTTAECFAWASRLMALGADTRVIYEKLFLSDSAPRFRLLARALAGAELRRNDRVVVLSLRQADFSACQADQAHTENLIDQACRLKTMVVALLFVEQPDGIVRVSLRSREPLDVNRFATRFGGGGHCRAAGMKIPGAFEDVKARVLAALDEEIL